MGAFLLALHIGLLTPVISNVISKIAAGIFAFILHRSFTFKSEEDSSKLNQAIRYFSLLLINIPLSSVILSFFLIWLADFPEIAKVISDVIYVAINYFLAKYFIFAKKT